MATQQRNLKCKCDNRFFSILNSRQVFTQVQDLYYLNLLPEELFVCTLFGEAHIVLENEKKIKKI